MQTTVKKKLETFGIERGKFAIILYLHLNLVEFQSKWQFMVVVFWGWVFFQFFFLDVILSNILKSDNF